MNFSREPLCEKLFNEMLPLLEKHYLEIAHYKDIKLNPDLEKYLAIENTGMLRTFTARSEDGALLGYSVFFIRENLHYKDSIQAYQDVIFIERSKRGAGFGQQFIEYCDNELRKDHCQVVYHHVKQKYNFGPMLEGIGYELVDLIYAKRLDGK